MPLHCTSLFHHENKSTKEYKANAINLLKHIHFSTTFYAETNDMLKIGIQILDEMKVTSQKKTKKFDLLLIGLLVYIAMHHDAEVEKRNLLSPPKQLSRYYSFSTLRIFFKSNHRPLFDRLTGNVKEDKFQLIEILMTIANSILKHDLNFNNEMFIHLYPNKNVPDEKDAKAYRELYDRVFENLLARHKELNFSQLKH